MLGRAFVWRFRGAAGRQGVGSYARISKRDARSDDINQQSYYCRY